VETWCDVSTTSGRNDAGGAVVPETLGLKYTIAVMEDNAPANGFSANSVLVRVSEPDDTPCAGLPIAFTVDHYGVAQVNVVSSRVGRCTLTVVDGEGKRRSTGVNFTQRRSGLTLALR
jgi:hypothetical protein